MSGLPSLLEVMQLVSGQVQGPDSSAAVELTGSSDPLRISARHSLSLQRQTLTVTLEVYNRLPVDVRNAFIRCTRDLCLHCCPILKGIHTQAVMSELKRLSSCSMHILRGPLPSRARPDWGLGLLNWADGVAGDARARQLRSQTSLNMRRPGPKTAPERAFGS